MTIKQTKKNAYANLLISLFPEELELFIVLLEDEKVPMLVVKIGEGITISDIQKHWSEITDYRHLLIQKTGSDLLKNNDILLYYLYGLHGNGWSYFKLSKLLNFRALACLLAYVGKNESFLYNETGWFELDCYFNALRFTSEERDQWIHDGASALNNGTLPWNFLNGPFTCNKIRNNLKNFQDRIKKKRLVVNQPWQEVCKENNLFEDFLYVNGYYLEAYLLLKQLAYKQWKVNKALIDEWLNKASELDMPVTPWFALKTDKKTG